MSKIRNNIAYVLEQYPEFLPYLEKINAAKDFESLLYAIIWAMTDDDLCKIGGLFYDGWQGSSICPAVIDRIAEIKQEMGL